MLFACWHADNENEYACIYLTCILISLHYRPNQKKLNLVGFQTIHFWIFFYALAFKVFIYKLMFILSIGANAILFQCKHGNKYLNKTQNMIVFMLYLKCF